MSEDKYLNAKERPHTSGEAPSIALHVQNSLIKYKMERKIFEELLELKRQQIRAGRANEQLLVKRLSDGYAKTINDLAGLRNYDGPFTFKEFEKYLYSKICFIVWQQLHFLHPFMYSSKFTYFWVFDVDELQVNWGPHNMVGDQGPCPAFWDLAKGRDEVIDVSTNQ